MVIVTAIRPLGFSIGVILVDNLGNDERYDHSCHEADAEEHGGVLATDVDICDLEVIRVLAATKNRAEIKSQERKYTWTDDPS